ncbi:MAG: sugar ABC transporter substrate-binding protein [Spirochaetota bacterium]
MESNRLRSALVFMLAGLLVSSCTIQHSDTAAGPLMPQSALGTDAGYTEGLNLRAYAGTELHILANDHPWVTHTAPRLQEFMDLTGVTVYFDVYPEEQFRIKRTVEMLSGISAYDAFMIMPGNSLSEYHAKGWVEALDPFMKDSRLAWPDYNLADLYPSALEASLRDGRPYSLPVLLETSILAYNKRIFATYGVEVPRTMQELEEAARTIYLGSAGRIAGLTMRGRDMSATSQWVDFLHSFGGDWLDHDGNAAIDSPQSIEALQFYGRLLRDYGPRDATRIGWYESVSLFMRGEAAMIYDANLFRTHYEDREHSTVFEDLGYAVIPAGPAGQVPHVSHWGLAIDPRSKHKEAAWLFIQWATAREQSLSAHLAGIPSARESVWKHPMFTDSDPVPEWTAASTRSYEIATFQWNPPVINTGEARQVVGEAISSAILGQDVAAAARKASAGLDAILALEREGQPSP